MVEGETRQAVDNIIKRAETYCTDMGDTKLTVEHLVLALAQNPRFSEVLSCAEGLTEDDLKRAIRKSRMQYGHADSEALDLKETAITKYARNLTELAKEKKLDPVVGRSDEIRRCINILCRRTKNNPVILGDSGVGKTTIVEGLAQRIVSGDVPPVLEGANIMALDLGSMMAGAFFPGEFEERMKAVLRELQQDPKNILFIDDIHTVTGPNAQQGGGVMDASVLLKPVLGRGELRCIGCTTMDKFRKFIEKDPALERRFQQVTVEAPTVTQTVSILRGIRTRYEGHHGVKITDAALVAAANLSDRYITDRFLPDKAIDLVDEATAEVMTDVALRPEAVDKLSRRIHELESERKSLLRSVRYNKDDAAELVNLDGELEKLRAQLQDATAKVELERGALEELDSLQEEVDRLFLELEAAEAGEDAADLEEMKVKRARRDVLVKKLKSKLKAAKKKNSSSRTASKHVTEADIARIISKWTGIPLTKLVQSEKDKLLRLADELHQRIIGQEEAVAAVAEAIQRSRAGMKDPNGPIASFLFLGPTGVGKTELVKALAATLFNSEDALVRIDMSEYMEKHAVSKLIGAPPGYVGFDEGGQLTEAVRRKPYTVVLFDEVEKAHVDVFNLLLQILDDGRVTDSQGRMVSFKNAIIIMTSNLGSGEIYAKTVTTRKKNQKMGTLENGPQSTITEEVRELVMDKVRKHFQPEFLNRVDEFIIFEPLQSHQIHRIVRLRTKGVISRLEAEKKLKLELKESAVEYLAMKGYDPLYGARPVRRAVQRELETPLAKALLRGDFQEEDTIVVESKSGGSGLRFARIAGPATANSSEDEEEAGQPEQTPGVIRQDGSLLHGSNGTEASRTMSNGTTSVKKSKFDPLRLGRGPSQVEGKDNGQPSQQETVPEEDSATIEPEVESSDVFTTEECPRADPRSSSLHASAQDQHEGPAPPSTSSVSCEDTPVPVEGVSGGKSRVKLSGGADEEMDISSRYEVRRIDDEYTLPPQAA